MTISAFVGELQRLHKTGQTTEHSFRPALARLFDSIDAAVTSINEPQAIINVGRPDFVLTRRVGKTLITVGHCEAKDVGLKTPALEERAKQYVEHVQSSTVTPH